ncbi:MAG: hypothetical protein Q9227_002706 [Pyrenula ochraceoflavens]
MQPASWRLARVVRTAFKVSRPATFPHKESYRSFVQPAEAFHRPRICSRTRLLPKDQSLSYSTEPQNSGRDTSSPDSQRSNPQSQRSPSQSHIKPPSSTHPLPSNAEHARSLLSKRFTHLLDNMQSLLLTSSQRLNDLTGYTGIEALKSQISSAESSVDSTRTALRTARSSYTTAIAQRSSSQREVNELLQRKHTWSQEDVERFTSLYRSDHANEVAEAEAQSRVADAEREAEEAGERLRGLILARYHEEQIWSDKIRRMSTWGTWGLMGVNILLFLVFQVAVEPWRRRRLVRGFEEKVQIAIEGERARDPASNPSDEQTHVSENIQQEKETPTTTTAQTSTPDPAMETVEAVQEEILPLNDISGKESPPSFSSSSSSPPPTEPPKPQEEQGLAAYTDTIRDLFSTERKLVVTQKEVTAFVLEGAAGGAAVMGLLFVLLRPR